MNTKVRSASVVSLLWVRFGIRRSPRYLLNFRASPKPQKYKMGYYAPRLVLNSGFVAMTRTNSSELPNTWWWCGTSEFIDRSDPSGRILVVQLSPMPPLLLLPRRRRLQVPAAASEHRCGSSCQGQTLSSSAAAGLVQGTNRERERKE